MTITRSLVGAVFFLPVASLSPGCSRHVKPGAKADAPVDTPRRVRVLLAANTPKVRLRSEQTFVLRSPSGSVLHKIDSDDWVVIYGSRSDGIVAGQLASAVRQLQVQPLAGAALWLSQPGRDAWQIGHR